jgi:CheY-like chemotaxis protein
MVTLEENMSNDTPTILYVDSDIGKRILVAVLLADRGFSVRTAKSARNALELVSTHTFDVVIIDYNLPDMTGVQLAREIRSLELSARIILVSTRAHLPAEELAYVDVHMAKGSAIDRLTDTISNLALLHSSATDSWTYT